MQKSRTASRHPGDENRPLNRRSLHGSQPAAPRLSQPQSSLEQLLQVNPHEKPSEGMKLSLKLKAIQQNPERRFDGRITEILQSGPASRLGAKRVTFQQP